ncbi:MAG: response regulator transcription factor [Candidatus Ornithomonoglobus sp.]
MVNVLIVDDQRIGRHAMEGYVRSVSDCMVVHSIENASMAELYCERGQIDLILMDVCTEHGESGLAAAAKIKRHYPHIKIIIVTSMPEHSFIEKAKKAGCESFWYKDIGDEPLPDVIRRTMAGESVYPDAAPVLDIGLAKSNEFTPRELEVLREIISGSTYKEIAKDLGISENTLKTHIKSLLSKSGYKSTLQLAVDAVNKKLILPGF